MILKFDNVLYRVLNSVSDTTLNVRKHNVKINFIVVPERKSNPLIQYQRATCIKGHIWPPLEKKKLKRCFSPISSNCFIRRISIV